MPVIVDAFGGDHSPQEIVKGCVAACQETEDLQIVLVGQQEKIREQLALYEHTDRITVQDAREVISPNEAPVEAIKKKKDSSMVVGLMMLKNKQGEAFVSAGSTGALLSGALLRVGRIKGVQRPALAAILPSKKQHVLLLDSGANMDCRPDHLEQFAVMGSVYAEKIMGIASPKVGLANVGAEEHKGNELTKTVHGLLSENTLINFQGNIEGRDIFDGDTDVVVCDGFAGNMILKTAEGIGMFVLGEIKKMFLSSLKNKLAALLVKSSVSHVKKSFDYAETGGAPLLGVNGVVIKAHGSSKAKAIKNAILQAHKMVKEQVVETISEQMEQIHHAEN